MLAHVRRRRGGSLVSLLVLVGSGLAIAACGDDADTDASASAGSAPVKKGLARAERTVKELSARPEQTVAATPLPEIEPGTKMVFLKCGVPVCETYAQGAVSAAERMRVEMKVLNAGSSPESQARAWDQAVLEDPAAVLEVGFQLSLFGKQIAQLEAKDAPIISGGDEGKGVTSNIQPRSTFNEIGARVAAYAIAETDGKGKIVFVNTPEIPLVTQIRVGFEQAVGEDCPDCELDLMEVQLRDIGRAIPSQVVSYMQKNPDIDWIHAGFGDVAAGVPEALKGAGITEVSLSSSAGSKINWGYIEAGNVQVMDLGVDTVMMGWWMFDRAARAIGGENTTERAPLQQQYHTKDTIDFDLNEGWTAVDGFEDKFVEAWAGG